MILFVGIYRGVVTPTEAAIIAAFYSLLIGVFAYRDLKIKDLPKVFLASCETTGVVLALVMVANIFGYVLSVAQVPQIMSKALLSFAHSKVLLLLV